jgi:hypothetical protein
MWHRFCITFHTYKIVENEMSIKNKLSVLLTAAALLAAGAANAAVVTVDAMGNSIGGGAALNTGVVVQSGQWLNITADASQTWNFGSGDPTYTTDADGKAGWIMEALNPDSSLFQAAIGALVGQIDNGNFFTVGTSFHGQVTDSGTLQLWYWDSDSWNNIGAVEANISVPEPGSLALVGLGLAALARRRRSAA